MGMLKFRPPTWTRPLKDPLARDISAEFARRIVALRLEANISRRIVTQRTGIHWKKIRQMEEGWSVASLVDVVRLADLYGVSRSALVDDLVIKANRGKAALKRKQQKCLCERLGEDGRAALRGIVRKLAPHARRVSGIPRKRRRLVRE